MVEAVAMSKVDSVRSLFDKTEKYLNPRQFDIRIRVETVAHLTRDVVAERAVDIGCGDGSISLPVLPRCNHLTLVDVSSKMLDLASQRIPAERSNDVELINGDVMNARLASRSFDLIFCLGVLAHVDSPAALISELARLAKPGASVILECTDSYHFWGIPVVMYQKMLKLFRPEPYALNRLRHRQILRLCQENGLRVTGLYRYGLPPLGASTFAGPDDLYRSIRGIFGPSDRNRNAWLGNQFIFRLRKA